jgi:hypothetical protein
MGLVTLSNEASLVGTMTSGGTDVIEMSASLRSTTGATFDVFVDDGESPEVGSVERVVATVVGAPVEALDDAVETGAPDEFGDGDGAAAPAAHTVVRNTRTPSHRPNCGKGCDFTLSSLGHRTAAACPDGIVQADTCPETLV